MTAARRARTWIGLAGVGIAAACVACAAPAGAAPVTVVDDFERPSAWSAQPSDGVALTLHADTGPDGRGAMRLDFEFLKGGGYALVHRDLSLDLPANYRFRFRVRGACRPNNLEFKLVDASGANVWWSNQRDFVFPAAWDSVSLKKRHIGFAWGPAGGGEIRHVAAIEFAVTAGSGGKGSVWLDDLTLEALPPPDTAPPPPVARASSSAPGAPAAAAVDRVPASAWRSAAGDPRPWLALDLGGEREFGAIVIDWAPGHALRDYDLEVSPDGVAWRVMRAVRGSNGGRDALFLPEHEARFLRVHARAAPHGGCAIRECTVEPLAFGASLDAFHIALAKDVPRGRYPRAWSGEQSYWTVVGVDRDDAEALMDEDGRIETGKAQFALEPFLWTRSRLVTWADARITHALVDGALPMPRVTWRSGDLTLEVTAFADGAPGASTVVGRYRVHNLGARAAQATLFLALRPFQVNPPTQFLNTPGGAAPLRAIAFERGVVRVDGERGVTSRVAPSGFGAATEDEGDVVEFLAAGRLPSHSMLVDSSAQASGALAYRLDLAPGAAREVDVEIPLHGAPRAVETGEADTRAEIAARFERCREAWHTRLERVSIELPDSDVVRTIRSQLADILVNRDGAAIQPGSRSYERAWIRDGALASSALLRLGQADVVREFIEWFAPFQYDDGRIPCCADRRGADPVPEYDSGGEFIMLVAEYVRYTHDTAFAARWWPAVDKAARALDALRQQRRTAEWRTPANAPYFGLLPPSISHEGYSAKPMHSYWDDFFALRGFQDAAALAATLGHDDARAQYQAMHAEFARELLASIRAAMAAHHIDYIPGCADLGDFDATSTAIALAPVGALDLLPADAVRATFERYDAFFRARRDGPQTWNDYTPYETRMIAAYVRLGWAERAHALLDYFMRDRRPPEWNQWAEVVGREVRQPRFIGDMPHTWVGSEFVRSVLDMIAYEREGDGALVLGRGVTARWMRGDGVAVRGLPTTLGALAFTLRRSGANVEARVDGVRVPGAGVLVYAPAGGTWPHATVDGVAAPLADGAVTVRHVPATVTFLP